MSDQAKEPNRLDLIFGKEQLLYRSAKGEDWPITVNEDSPWWWLSFCDAERPEGDQFLGVCVVQGDNLATAVTVAHARKINPGGEVAWCQIPNGHIPAAEYRNRLLSKRELEEAGL